MFVARGILKIISCGETDSETLSGLASLRFVCSHSVSIYLSLIIAFIEMCFSKPVLQDVSLFFFMKGGWFQGRR